MQYNAGAIFFKQLTTSFIKDITKRFWCVFMANDGVSKTGPIRYSRTT